MQTSLIEQINAIREMIGRVRNPNAEPKPVVLNPIYLADTLNDAASTIAALNLNPDIFDKVSKLEKELHECRVFLSNVKPGLVEAFDKYCNDRIEFLKQFKNIHSEGRVIEIEYLKSKLTEIFTK